MATTVYTLKPTAYSSHTLLLELFPSNGAGRHVLDVGCGEGFFGELLARRGYRVTGIERPGGYSNAFSPEVELVEADLDNGLPPLPHVYDYIVCADVLEHLKDPGTLLRDLRHVMTPGAMLIASLPNSGNIWFRLNILAGRFPQDDKGLFDRTHLRFFMWAGWVRLFENAGFRFHSVRPTAIPVSLVVPESLSTSAPVRTAESVFYGMARIWKTLFAYQFVVCARVRD